MKKSEVNLAKLLTYLKNYQCQHGYTPSYREMQSYLGLKSVNTVDYYINKLVERDLIRKNPLRKRAIEIVDDTKMLKNSMEMTRLPLLGKIAGGQPILAEENLIETYAISKNFFGTEQDLFLLKVVGDSMKEGGIANGDTIIVKVQNTAEDGDIVVARVDSGTTVKKFYREKNGYRLQPQNQLYFPIYTHKVEILGKVIGVIKRF
ncbi:MAG TPA: transcriptional repressor LexA [Candidatus Caccopulliclostridium gallistercoris]|uniref:LexA repressor n=1 Tax=Candidatus Caccopulliclostridium gallistercoris TaxID=2840719 RepID=A0A9D1SZ74_9FIRM|nr:transcriptional repressor LexA [Candidatus Caccopulliclostridium gallistercoris]